jgi:RNA polymerase sigma factor (sigma-70 family)
VAVDVTAVLPGGDPSRFIRNEPDEALVAFVLQGSEAAFEAIYDRHHRGLIAFCRHMLRSREEAEDALQHTFAAAYRSLTAGERPNALKPWLYTIARNRCLTVLRARRTRDDVVAAETPTDGAVVEGLSDAVQRRSDLRDLVADLHRLPEDQRAALVLFELGDHSHAEIADVLSVDRDKVKALVFQAREGLMRARTARNTPCAEIRHHLSSRTRALPRRGVIRGHLDCCPSCAAYDLEVRRQRAALAIALPVVPSLGLKGSILGPLLGGGGAIAAGGAAAVGTGATGAVIGAGAAGSGAAGLGAAGGAAAIAGGAGSGLTGGAAMGGLGALAANAVVAKVVTVVAVAGAAAGAGQAIHARHQADHRPAVASNTTAVVTQSKPTPPRTVPAPVVPADQTTTTTIVPPRVVNQTVTQHVPAATTATGPASATKPSTSPASTTQDPAGSDPSAPATGGTAADGTTAGGSAPTADPTPSTDPGASGSAPSTPPDTTPAESDPVVFADELPPDPPAGDPASDPATAAPVTCPAGTVPLATNPTASPPATPPATDPATAPPAPTLTLLDGTVVPIPTGCGFLPVVAGTTAGADPAIVAAAAQAETPPTP